MKKLFTVLALCASVLVATAKTDDPKKAAVKAPVKKEACAKGGECCKKDAGCHKAAATVAPKAKAPVKKS